MDQQTMRANNGWGRSSSGKRVVHERPRKGFNPTLLVLGHVCRDTIGNQHRLGGAASFAARAAASLGVQTAVVTATPKHWGLLEPLRNHPNITLSYWPSDAGTAFELDYSGSTRRLRLLSRAQDLVASFIPPHALRAPLAYVCPIIGECDRALMAALPCQRVVVGAQGWLRAVTRSGRLKPTVADEILEPPANMTAAVFSELDHPEADALARHLAGHSVLVALTRGAAGLSLYTGTQRWEVQAAPAVEVDPTGAGDVFGVVFALALQHGHSVRTAATQGAYAAARVVEGPGLGNLTQVQGDLIFQPLRSAEA